MNSGAWIRSIFAYSGAIFIGAICFVPCFVIALMPARYRYDSRLFYWLSDLFFKSVVNFTCLPIDVQGRNNIPRNQSVIFAGNHQSALDIPVMGSLCNGMPQIWLVMSHYLKAPFLGFFVRRMNVPVYQDSIARSAYALQEVIKLTKNYKRDIVIFPEGRRIKDRRISSFMKGFAVIARVTGKPVVPVFMPNNGKIHPPGDFLIYYYTLKVVIGKPFYYEKSDTDESFSERVHQWFIEQSE